MPVCECCREPYQQAATFCPHCDAPLTGLAARIREAGPGSWIVVLHEAKGDRVEVSDLTGAASELETDRA